jgi:hypothetical protein
VIDFESLLKLLAMIGMVLGVGLVNRWLAEPGGPALSEVLDTFLNPPMRKVKEEDEPARWQVERLHPYRSADRPMGAPVPSPHTLAHPAGGAFGIGTGHSR